MGRRHRGRGGTGGKQKGNIVPRRGQSCLGGKSSWAKEVLFVCVVLEKSRVLKNSVRLKEEKSVGDPLTIYINKNTVKC